MDLEWYGDRLREMERGIEVMRHLAGDRLETWPEYYEAVKRCRSFRETYEAIAGKGEPN